MFYGYKATIFRDLPFSALQFAFYEQEQALARQYTGSRDIGLGLEIATATSAGGLAGVMTCPLDVVKTRIQTQINPPETPTSSSGSANAPISQPLSTTADSNRSLRMNHYSQTMQKASSANRSISTSSPSTTLRKPDAVTLDTSSVTVGLKLIYRTEGILGLFRGVGPRFVWTSVQSGTMLVLYQTLLRRMAVHPWFDNEGSSVI